MDAEGEIIETLPEESAVKEECCEAGLDAGEASLMRACTIETNKLSWDGDTPDGRCITSDYAVNELGERLAAIPGSEVEQDDNQCCAAGLIGDDDASELLLGCKTETEYKWDESVDPRACLRTVHVLDEQEERQRIREVSECATADVWTWDGG